MQEATRLFHVLNILKLKLYIKNICDNSLLVVRSNLYLGYKLCKSCECI